jgi:PAS domain S-box-containing protein
MAWSRQAPLTRRSENSASEIAVSEALFDSIGEAVIATDGEGRVMRVNEAMLELFEFEESDLLGKKYMTIVHALTLKGEPIKPLNRPIMRALIEGRRINDTVLYVKGSGKTFPAHLTVSPIMLDGEPIGTIQVIRDITHEQKIDRAKTEFVSLASHQLRTPLTAMRWYIELLLRHRMGPLTKEQEDSLGEVYRVNLRLIELVGALLSVARIEIGTLTIAPVPSDISQLARDVTAELKPQITEKNLQFNEQYDPEIPTMMLDPDLTRIIFQNILTNAVKYTPSGGEIGLKIDLKKNHVLIQISDTGYGVPKRQQRQLFTKLFRADNVRRQDTDGTGLGLYIVQSIVESARGKIWFESEENKGTTFFVRLPLKGMPAMAESDRLEL